MYGACLCNALWYCHWWPRFSVRRTSLVQWLTVHTFHTCDFISRHSTGKLKSTGGRFQFQGRKTNGNCHGVAQQCIRRLPVSKASKSSTNTKIHRPLFHSADLQSAIAAQICASGRHRPDKTAHKLDSHRAPKKAIQPRDPRDPRGVLLCLTVLLLLVCRDCTRHNHDIQNHNVNEDPSINVQLMDEF